MALEIECDYKGYSACYWKVTSFQFSSENDVYVTVSLYKDKDASEAYSDKSLMTKNFQLKVDTNSFLKEIYEALKNEDQFQGAKDV